MRFGHEIDEEVYREYRVEVHGERMIEAMRSGIVVVVSLNALFILFDLWVFPQFFLDLLVVRLTWSAVMMAIHQSPLPRDAASRAQLACHCTGLGLVVVIAGAGGLDSGYAPGLMLLFLGLPVLLPMSAGEAARVVTLSLFALGALPLLTGSPFDYRAWGMNMFFPTAAAIECVASCAVLEGMRVADFCQRRQIQRARDELAELDQAKSRFSANVHHELRTPLTLILAPLDALRSGDFGELSGLLAETVETMHANGRRLYKLISNLLDLSKLESKLFEISRAPTDLGELVADLVTAARGMADRKNIELGFEGFESLPSINADATAIEKILMNLVGNSLKFTPPGGRIWISGAASADRVSIRVSDTGAGIPSDKLEAVFDRFAQVDGSVTRAHEGTGIGLSLALELAQLHGGDICADSAGLDQGTTMTVSLPVGEADVATGESLGQPDAHSALGLSHPIEAVEAELNLERSSAVREGLREIESTVERWEDRAHDQEVGELTGARSHPKLGEVVIAEDNPDMRRLLATLLSREFHVRTARNGREALERVHESMPDLLLSDVMMPEMSGIELCRAVKNDDETRSLPVVLVTSKAEHEMRVEGLELGADDYITKPFHPRELLARVRTLVRVRHLQTELAQKNDKLQATLDELRQAEVQIVHSERLAAIGELAAGIAHEVNNPVNFALNAARALAAECEGVRELAAAAAEFPGEGIDRDDRRSAKFLNLASPTKLHDLSGTVGELSEIIQSGLERTQALVADLRDFAAPGRKQGQVQEVDLEKAIRSTLHLLRGAMCEAGAEVELVVEEGLPMIAADRCALNQVFLNLLKNALDALGPRGGAIGVRVGHDDKAVCIEVEDEGPGIPSEIISRIFDPFFTTKGAGKGTGLGLSISRQIVESHGGTLEAGHAASGRTRFAVSIPIGT